MVSSGLVSRGKGGGGCMFLNKRGYQQEGMKKERGADTPFHTMSLCSFSAAFLVGEDNILAFYFD